jgi:pimeloyl-ACP methyl ester carboxylesterase
MTFKNVFYLIIISLFTGCSSQEGFEIKKAKVDDIELAYYIRGHGEPLLMIMGFRGTMGVWDPQLLEILEKHYQLILFDNRGIGFSTDSEEDHTTIPQMANDTLGLIKSLGYDRVHVLGWSMGSMIAMQLAVTHPEVIDTLILCSASPGKQDVPRTTNAFNEMTTVSTDQERQLALLFPTTQEGIEAARAFQKRLMGAVLNKTIPQDISVSPITVERQKNALTQWFDKDSNTAYEALASLKIPTLVAGGIEDALDPVANVQMIARKIPYCWSAYFPEAGHAFLFQEAKTFAELIIIFNKAHHRDL